MRALVLGCGSIGARHTRNLVGLGLEVVVYDPDRDRAQALGSSAGAEVVSDRDQAVGVDMTVVASPTHRHVDDLGWALGKGSHVFVEKPLGATRQDLARALELGRAHPDRIAMVACNTRFTDGFRKLQDNLGSIGELLAVSANFGWHLPNWRPGQDYHVSYSAHRDQGGGVILDAIHEIDYVVSLAGPVADVSAMWRPGLSLGIEAEELAEIVLRHRSGVISSVHLDYLQPRYTRWCRLTGADGTLLWDYAEHRLERWIRASAEVEVLLEDADQDGNAMYVAEMEHFLGGLGHGSPAVNGIEEAGAVLDVALSALERGKPR